MLVPLELVAWWVKHHSLRLHVLFNRKNNNNNTRDALLFLYSRLLFIVKLRLIILIRIEPVESVFRDLPAAAVPLTFISLISHPNIANERLKPVIFGRSKLQ